MGNILFVHLLNNYTGSPMVLANYLKKKGVSNKDHITILTSNTSGALSNIEGVTYKNNFYKWRNNKFFLTLNLLFSHIYQFLFVLCSKKYDVVYINTVLPFGASLAAKIRKKKIIYHVHEFYEKPNLMHKICMNIMCKNANVAIFVSEYLKQKYDGVIHCKSKVVYNSTSEYFEIAAKEASSDTLYLKRKFDQKNILMVCSLKQYKGVEEFVKLAQNMNDFTFKLVLSCDKASVEKYFRNTKLPSNLIISTQISNMIPFYREAFLCLNLSHPYGESVWVETFGMTLIEASCFGVPVFGPNAGGPKEIVKDGYNGFLINPYDIENISKKILLLANDFNKYLIFCNNSFEKMSFFSVKVFVDAIDEILEVKNEI